MRKKRSAVIDELIGSPEFIDYWTNKWSDMLQVNSKFLGGEGSRLFRDWIKKGNLQRILRTINLFTRS